MEFNRPELIAEICFSEQWLQILTRGLDHAKINDRRHAVVTDRMGVEVRPFDDGDLYLDEDRFPLKAFSLGTTSLPPSSASSPSSVSSWERATSISTQTSILSWTSGDDVSLGSRETEPARELQFEDVWPGIFRIKLGSVVGQDNENVALQSLFATDATGVEVDLCSYVEHMPDSRHFPLKLHFHSKGAVNARQNVEDHMDSTEMNNLRSRTSIDRECRQHSTELTLASVLPDVINARLKDLGMHGLDVLVTDRLGGQVCISEGVPDRARFPLKLHIVDSDGSLSRNSRRDAMPMTTKFFEWGERKRKFFKNELSKLRGSGRVS